MLVRGCCCGDGSRGVGVNGLLGRVVRRADIGRRRDDVALIPDANTVDNVCGDRLRFFDDDPSFSSSFVERLPLRSDTDARRDGI
jgi:hypothetical protein